ncbi:MAG: Jag family protein [Armatimonadota bacterium]
MSDAMTNQPLPTQAQVAHEVLTTILKEMEFPGTVEVTEDEEQVVLTIISDQPMGLLIGKGGQTLDAIELIVKQIVQQKTKERGKHLVVDAEGYRSRHAERLQEMGREAAHRVLETGESEALEPMSPRDRRTVHMAISEVEGVETFSAGEDPYRHIVICLPGQQPGEGEEE